jgi:hypothetical protein
MPVDLKGFDELKRKVAETKRKVAETKRKGEAGVQLNELFHHGFMTDYTDFRSIDDMAEASGFDIKSVNDFDNIPESFFKSHTKFSCWGEMIRTATEQWVARNIGFRD